MAVQKASIGMDGVADLSVLRSSSANETQQAMRSVHFPRKATLFDVLNIDDGNWPVNTYLYLSTADPLHVYELGACIRGADLALRDGNQDAYEDHFLDTYLEGRLALTEEKAESSSTSTMSESKGNGTTDNTDYDSSDESIKSVGSQPATPTQNSVAPESTAEFGFEPGVLGIESSVSKEQDTPTKKATAKQSLDRQPKGKKPKAWKVQQKQFKQGKAKKLEEKRKAAREKEAVDRAAAKAKKLEPTKQAAGKQFHEQEEGSYQALTKEPEDRQAKKLEAEQEEARRAFNESRRRQLDSQRERLLLRAAEHQSKRCGDHPKVAAHQPAVTSKLQSVATVDTDASEAPTSSGEDIAQVVPQRSVTQFNSSSGMHASSAQALDPTEPSPDLVKSTHRFQDIGTTMVVSPEPSATILLPQHENLAVTDASAPSTVQGTVIQNLPDLRSSPCDKALIPETHYSPEVVQSLTAAESKSNDKSVSQIVQLDDQQTSQTKLMVPDAQDTSMDPTGTLSRRPEAVGKNNRGWKALQKKAKQEKAKMQQQRLKEKREQEKIEKAATKAKKLEAAKEKAAREAEYQRLEAERLVKEQQNQTILQRDAAETLARAQLAKMKTMQTYAEVMQAPQQDYAKKEQVIDTECQKKLQAEAKSQNRVREKADRRVQLNAVERKILAAKFTKLYHGPAKVMSSTQSPKTVLTKRAALPMSDNITSSGSQMILTVQPKSKALTRQLYPSSVPLRLHRNQTIVSIGLISAAISNAVLYNDAPWMPHSSPSTTHGDVYPSTDLANTCTALVPYAKQEQVRIIDSLEELLTILLPRQNDNRSSSKSKILSQAEISPIQFQTGIADQTPAAQRLLTFHKEWHASNAGRRPSCAATSVDATAPKPGHQIVLGAIAIQSPLMIDGPSRNATQQGLTFKPAPAQQGPKPSEQEAPDPELSKPTKGGIKGALHTAFMVAVYGFVIGRFIYRGVRAVARRAFYGLQLWGAMHNFCL